MRQSLILRKLPEDGRIAAVLPTYTDEGDATRVLLSTGEEITLRVQTKRTLELLAARHSQSLTLLRRWGRYHVSGSNALTLAMTPELVLLPLRVRTPRVHGDATLGFVNAALGEMEIRPSNQGDGTELLLPTGQSIPVLWRTSTVRRHLLAARLLAHQRRAEATESFFRQLRHMLA